MAMRPLIHALGVECKHPHVNETIRADQVTCPACIRLMALDKTHERRLDDLLHAEIKPGSIETPVIDPYDHLEETNKNRLNYYKEHGLPPASASKEVICTCGSKMVLRSSKMGAFYGCSRYPLCKEIEYYH